MEVAAAKSPGSRSLPHESRKFSTKSQGSVSLPAESRKFAATSQLPSIDPDDLRKLTANSHLCVFSPDELRKFTDNYSQDNFLGGTKFSKLYRGKIDSAEKLGTRAVAVKIFYDSKDPVGKLSLFKDEIYLLQHPSIQGHRNLPKLIGYCTECVGVVYDINPKGTLANLIPQDDFTWLQRIKVALHFSNLLVFFHNYKPPNLVRDIEAAQLMLDQDNNPVLFEFGMLVGGLFDEAEGLPNRKLIGPCDSMDPFAYTLGGQKMRGNVTDVFKYGVLLLNLIAKRVFYIWSTEQLKVQWSKKESQGEMSWLELEKYISNGSEIFKEDPDFDAYDGQKIVKLVMCCIDKLPEDCPTSNQILESLQALHVVEVNELWEAGKSRVVEILPSVFSELGKETFLGDTQSGKLYSAVLSSGADSRKLRSVTVKIWHDSMNGFTDKLSNMTDEVCFLRHPCLNGHRKNLVEPIGYSRNGECLGIIYDLNPRDTLFNLIFQDNFTWLQRIKVALQFARLLVFLHSFNPPFIIGNISAAHIVVNQECNPVLLDFAMLMGGFFSKTRDKPNGKSRGVSGCTDYHMISIGGCSLMHDVFSFGVILVSLIAKRVFDISWPKTSVASWAKKDGKDKVSWSALERNVFSEHEIFKEDPDYDVYDGRKLMKLAISCIELLPKDRPTMKEIYESMQGLHVVRLNGMGFSGEYELLECLPCQLREFTGEFSEENYIGESQFGKLYRGVILNGANPGEAHVVTVKIWDDSVCGFASPEDKMSKLMDEVCLLRHLSVKSYQQNLPKVLAYSRKYERLGIVYDLNPMDTLHNLIVQDEFTWAQRIKVALQLARLLVFFHSYDPPFIVRNISAANIMIVQDYNPVLFDFGMLLGGIFGNTRNIPNGNLSGAPGYEDFHFLSAGGWSVERDVFSYGVLLLSLLSKKLSESSRPETSIVFWAKRHFEWEKPWPDLKRNMIRVRKIFEEDPDFDIGDACELMRLALCCIEFDPKGRPTMKEILQSLQTLLLVQCKGIIEGLKSEVHEFSPHELNKITAGYVDQSFFRETQFHRLYYGNYEGNTVTVKMFDPCQRDLFSRLTGELYLLQHPSVNGQKLSLPKPIGYCTRDGFRNGIVYDLNPKNTLDKLVLEGNFTWLQRIKIALQFARLLVFFHNYDPPFIVGNIAAAHIVVDKYDNPVLLDMGALIGGLLGRVWQHHPGVLGYMDPDYTVCGRRSVASDVFAYGIVLQSLVTKTVIDGTLPITFEHWYTGASKERISQAPILSMEDAESKAAIVHGIFKDDEAYDQDDGFEITKLVFSCLYVSTGGVGRPRIKEVFERLLALHVVQRYSKKMGF